MAGTETNSTMDIRLDHLNKNIDDMFLIFNAIIVSLMQSGFACLEAGCVNSKNVTSIIMKNVLDLFICAICYWLVGYTFAYSPGNSFLGYTLWAGVGVPEGSMAHWFFQFVFAATAATIISGAVAERCNFTAYIFYSCVISGFVYPVVSHWAWGEDGYLGTLGYRDFAGSGVVHVLAGVCSFVAAAFVGPRIGRFENGVVVDKPGHSIPLVGIGGLLLVSGFLAFNGGSLGHISQPGDSEVVARALISTIMGGSGAAVVVLVLSKAGLLGPPVWAFSVTLNAVLAGMVSVCAAADIFPTLGAIVTGAIACMVYLFLRSFVIFLKVDDPLDAVAVHFGGGIWGVIAMPIFAKGGLVYGFNDKSIAQLWHNVVGALLIIVWSGVCSVVLFGLLRLCGKLRVSETEELEGLSKFEASQRYSGAPYPFCRSPACSFSNHITPQMGSMRAYTVLLWLLVMLVTVATGSVPLYMRDKPRTIRGFKNHALSTARGFGKRADSEIISPEIPQPNDVNSFPADWFADELQSNGELARLIVHKFIDSNQDGELSADELLRPLFEKPQAATYK